MAKILFVVTGADHWTLADGTKHPTGFWAEEAVAPYEAFTAAGHEVVVATPGGVVPTVDRGSLTPEFNGGQEGADRVAAALDTFTELRKPIALEGVDLGAYDAVFYPGGHGPMEDLAVNADSGRLLTAALASGKPLGVVCHAPAALLAATGPDGVNAFAGYRLTGFTNAEERQAGLADKAKWLLQDRLVEIGADFQEGEPWAPFVIVDRNLVTGQNPASSAPLAAELVKKLAA
ncbi:type 1 glutamine amidotransferase domain-containing protein [Streptomyces sp. NBC_01433]|uniref:type 1 glutamine amidotransferase domain-containing protein n=1 Tax=Streptomyces sp. NBC_01433 TaxID=2903864 RepID=UPI002250040A|nr:type 1 glutamine amidotransferase domain-containing protein [Streptomyces sp. NBC_01433]MCX4680272.1 type 1 glutamine amidotransferase domain-containing protein [Streptomyces sp. NBC_01433]